MIKVVSHSHYLYSHLVRSERLLELVLVLFLNNISIPDGFSALISA